MNAISLSKELALVEAAFSDGAQLTIKPRIDAVIPSRDAPGVVSIPPISDFAQIIDAELCYAEIDRAEFDATMDALAATVACQKFSDLTRAGEQLINGDDFIPLHVELTDAQVNWQAVCALEFSKTFRNHFGRYYLNTIVRDVLAKREREVRESFACARAGGE